MALPALTSDGVLPLGRWPATLTELEASFATGRGQLREEIWDEFSTLNSAMSACLTSVAAMWLGGSYFTTKSTPGDIDCVYVVDYQHLLAARADVGRAQFLQVVAGSQIKKLMSLRVDSFILEWVPTPGPAPGGPMARQYLEQRGYWDDLWSRARSSDTREDSLPRRGYLEVIVDGYT